MAVQIIVFVALEVQAFLGLLKTRKLLGAVCDLFGGLRILVVLLLAFAH